MLLSPIGPNHLRDSFDNQQFLAFLRGIASRLLDLSFDGAMRLRASKVLPARTSFSGQALLCEEQLQRHRPGCGFRSKSGQVEDNITKGLHP
jgi:hypothetical protein